MEKSNRKLKGIVVAVSNINTVKVKIEQYKTHRIYNKAIKAHKSYLVDMPIGTEVKVGDVVSIMETRPVSKNKTWKLDK